MKPSLPPARPGILATVGHTPLIPLDGAFGDARFQVYAKLEMLNPGGSVKDRSALNMLVEARAQGKIGPHTTIIESTSGNLGIGLAQACLHFGLHLICVVDTNITPANLAILQAYGVEVDMVREPDRPGGDLLSTRIRRVAHLCELIEDAFWVNQYANLANARAHYETMAEIHQQLPGRFDYLFVATSSCGTLRGCCDYARRELPETRIIAVDAVGSVIFGQEARKRLIPGHGASRVPELYAAGMEDDFVHVSDRECVQGCRRLLATEAIFAGGSSGGVIAGLHKYRHAIPEDSVCVAILCDRGERYLDTIYSPTWVREHFGDMEDPEVADPEPAVREVAALQAV